MDIETILFMYEDDYNPGPRPMAQGGRIPFGEAGLVDKANNVKPGDDLGRGISQRLKGKQIVYVASGLGDTPIKEYKTFKEAKDARKILIEKYGDPANPVLEKYKGKFNYKELAKDSDFVDFWKAKVDGDKIATRTGKFKGERSVEDAIQKVVKKYKLKPNDYEGIWNKVVEETRISEAVRKGTTFGKGKTKLISNAIIGNLIDTFNKSYKPNVGTINTSEMEELLKLSKGELSKLMSNIEKPYPEEALRFAKTDTVSRINKAAALKDILKQEGISYYKASRGDSPGKDYRFKLDPNKNIAAKKLKELENSKTFGFEKKTTTKSPKVKQIITTLSKQSDEYKKYGYGRDRGTIDNLTNALNNSLKSMSDKELYNFVNKNSKIKNLVTATFDAKKGEIKNVPLKNMDMQQIRNNAQFEVDHIRGRSTVDFDPATKKILNGIGIENPKNLYIIPKAINNSVKKQVENYVSNFPNETSKIKNIDNYFKKNKLTYFNRNKGEYGGYKPSKSALDMSHLGITKKKELENLITGTYIDDQGIERVKTKDSKKLIATINELSKTRGGTQLFSNPFFDPSLMKKVISDIGKGINIGLGPTGMIALTKYLEPEGGYDLSRTGDRLGFEAEAALAKPLVKGATSVTDKIKNPLLRKIAERAALAGMSPALAMRLARVASPIGLASLAGEAIYKVGKLGYEDQKRFNALSPEEQAAERAEQEKFAFDIEGS